MNSIAKLNRRVEVSAEISDYVYDYETSYTSIMKNIESKGDKVDPESVNREAISTLENLPSNTSIVDAMYDRKTGVAAIAVEDHQTEETYIAFAGTNTDADGLKDIISDANIGVNNSLYLKELAEPSLAFYDRVQKKGKTITVTTGHSYADFHSTRVAIERQVPYMFAYQGAPGSVSSRTAQEINATFKALLGGSIASSSIFMTPDVAASRVEAERVKALMEAYKGYAVTFSTDKDFLTNLVWEQPEGQIDYRGSSYFALGKEFGFHLPKYAILTGAQVGLMTGVDTQYAGQVVAINQPIAHDMKAYRQDSVTMALTKQVVVEQAPAIDVNSDGKVDHIITPDYLTTRPIVPTWASPVGTKQITLDEPAMKAMIANLTQSLNQVHDMMSLVNQAQNMNSTVMGTLSQRRQSLKDVVAAHMKTIKLVDAIADIDKAYVNIESKRDYFDKVSKEDGHTLVGQFQHSDYDGEGYYCDSNEEFWSYSTALNKLMAAVQASAGVKNDIDNTMTVSTGDNIETGFIITQTKTNMAKKGANLINSFEDMIEESTKGLDNRSHFMDGIPQAVNEILEVIQQNLSTIRDCVAYTIEVANVIKDTMVTREQEVASAISDFDFSGVSEVNVTIAQDYNTYLQSSGIFDDRKVISAFDDQVDRKADDLADQMSTAFKTYLGEAEEFLSETVSKVDIAAMDFEEIGEELDTVVYYKKGRSKPKTEVGKVSDFIDAASYIKAINKDLPGIRANLTTATTTINAVSTDYGSYHRVFRDGMEDAFYGSADLDGVVQTQKAVAMVLSTLRQNFDQFNQHMAVQQAGAAVNALSSKMDSTVTLMSYVIRVIDDCFGD